MSISRILDVMTVARKKDHFRISRMFFRVKTTDGHVLDIEIQDCIWYELGPTGTINVILRDERLAKGVVSQDQMRQLQSLPWLISSHPYADHFFGVEIHKDDNKEQANKETPGRMVDAVSKRKFDLDP